MSMYTVIEAAAYLDKYSDKNWRNNVNIDLLNMARSDKCILGQIYGDYHTGEDLLVEKSGWDKWEDVSYAFASYTDMWKEYLRKGVSGLLTDSKWYSINNPSFIVTIANTFTRDGDTFVVYFSSKGSVQVCAESAFRRDFNPSAKYVDGRLYLTKDRKTVFVYNAHSNKFFRLNNNICDSIPSVSVVYCEQFGPLTEITCKLNDSFGDVQGTLNVTYSK